MTENPIKCKGRELRALYERYGIERLALFGSALRDDFDPEKSDLNISVKCYSMSPKRHAGPYFGLLESLEELFGRHVDLVEIGAVRNPYGRREIEGRKQILVRSCGRRQPEGVGVWGMTNW